MYGPSCMQIDTCAGTIEMGESRVGPVDMEGAQPDEHQFEMLLHNMMLDISAGQAACRSTHLNTQ